MDHSRRRKILEINKKYVHSFLKDKSLLTEEQIEMIKTARFVCTFEAQVLPLINKPYIVNDVLQNIIKEEIKKRKKNKHPFEKKIREAVARGYLRFMIYEISSSDVYYNNTKQDEHNDKIISETLSYLKPWFPRVEFTKPVDLRRGYNYKFYCYFYPSETLHSDINYSIYDD